MAPVAPSPTNVLQRFVRLKSPKAITLDLGYLTDTSDPRLNRGLGWLTSKTPEAMIWMFADTASLEVSLALGRASGIVKEQPKILLHDCKDAVTVATSLLEVRCGDLVLVDGKTLDKIANFGLSDLFVERSKIAGRTIIHGVSAG